ncbi:MAG: response regulator, partial [Deltaproteobacteria bacterium]|nr:response regulator [Deltaproteobacteria bacterium]
MTAIAPDAPRLLVVDDEEGIRTTLEVLFRRTGYRVTLAADGNEAAAAIRDTEPFDLIVTDLAMPGL